jgi:hypothetical protein
LEGWGHSGSAFWAVSVRKDRHLLAAAVAAGPQVVVTFNLKDSGQPSTTGINRDEPRPEGEASRQHLWL